MIINVRITKINSKGKSINKMTDQKEKKIDKKLRWWNRGMRVL